MSPFTSVLGTAIIGSWLNFMLYTIELVMAYQYFKEYKKDRVGIKCLVYAALTSDTIGTIAIAIHVYAYCVLGWGDPVALGNLGWHYAVFVLTGALTGFFVQVYLTWRYWNLSRQHVIGMVLAIFTLTTIIAASFTVATVIQFPDIEHRIKLSLPATIWCAATAGTDISIALALVWSLRSKKSNFYATQSLLQRLMIVSISTGSLTAVIAIVDLAVVVKIPQTGAQDLIAFCIGRTYTITMLYSLNIRNSIAHRRGRSISNASSYPTPVSSKRSETTKDTTLRSLSIDVGGNVGAFPAIELNRMARMGSPKTPTSPAYKPPFSDPEISIIDIAGDTQDRPAGKRF